MSDHDCKSGKTLDPYLHPSIIAPVREQGLQDALGQATSVVTSITEFFDPKKEAQTSIFAVLGALSLGFAFLTAPTVAAAMIAAKVSDSIKWSLQSAAISVSQAPGIGRSLWPSGTDTSTIYQIGQLQEKASDITETLSNRLSQALRVLMTDPVSFTTFADHGKYCEQGPPLDPNEIKNGLALSLQTYLTSESMKSNGWYAVPKGVTTKEEYDNRLQVKCSHPKGLCPSEKNHLNIYWSPASGRQYELGQHDIGIFPGAAIEKIKGWADLTVLFDGAYNCTKIGQRGNSELVHLNFDGTLDTSCISQLPIVRECRTPCPEYEADGSCLFPLKQDCGHPAGSPLIRGGTADQQRRRKTASMTDRPQSEKDADYWGPTTS
ncbi:MAG: hypothetical protein LQ337_002795 [Flavoplaca oasis]|nr:MAG: hypothetical protein LQ337_002795 [Flavoplaca oasis]